MTHNFSPRTLGRPYLRFLLISALLALTVALAAAAPSWSETQFLGPDFRVNDPDNTDSYPRVDSNAAGTSVVVWRCDQRAASGEICARRLSLTGRFAAPEFIVNGTPDGLQQFPDVAIDAEGNFLVVWESLAGEDGDGWSVLGRLFAPNGEPRTGQVVLSTQTAGRQRDPAVAWRPGLGWIVVWDTTHLGFEKVFARRFSQNLSPQGVEFHVSEEPSGFTLSGLNINADVDTDANGNFVVAWQGPRTVGVIGGSDVFARRYTAAGGALGQAFIVATDPVNQKMFPSVSVNGIGRFVILFAEGGDEISARRYGAGGQSFGSEFKVNQGPASPTGAAVAIADDGRFITTWAAASGTFPDGSFGVMQRVYRANGVADEGEQIVSIKGQRPDVAFDDAGDALVVYHASGPDARARFSQTTSVCVDTDTAACVQSGRFKVEAAWGAPDGDVGVGGAGLLTDATATFWFFSSSNIELVIKTLDACDITQTFWVFAAGATNVEVDLGVTDTETGLVRRYHNALGVPYVTVREIDDLPCASQALTSDTFGLQRTGVSPPLDLQPSEQSSEQWDSEMQVTEGTQELFLGELSMESERTPFGQARMKGTPPTVSPRGVDLALGTGPCVADNGTLCISQSRFRVTATYDAGSGQQSGNAVPLTSESGYFWFFDAGNVEILIKVLDACDFTQTFWVLAAGLTDVKVDLDVVDTETGQARRYSNAAGQGFVPVIETGAFATCQ